MSFAGAPWQMIWNPHDYWIYYVNIGLCHQYGISATESQMFLLAKRPRRRRARRNGCFRRLIYNMQIAVVKVFLNEPCEMCWCLQYCSRLHRVTMDEAKEVHTTLRTAAGIFKFVKVLVVVVVVLKWFVLNSC